MQSWALHETERLATLTLRVSADCRRSATGSFHERHARQRPRSAHHPGDRARRQRACRWHRERTSRRRAGSGSCVPEREALQLGLSDASSTLPWLEYLPYYLIISYATESYTIFRRPCNPRYSQFRFSLPQPESVNDRSFIAAQPDYTRTLYNGRTIVYAHPRPPARRPTLSTADLEFRPGDVESESHFHLCLNVDSFTAGGRVPSPEQAFT